MSSAAWYDLGLAHGIMNEFDGAEQACRAAETIVPKARHPEAIGHVTVTAEAYRRLETEP